MTHVRWPLIVLLALAASSPRMNAAAKKNVIIGYYAPWAIEAKDIKYEKLTHIALAFSRADKHGALYPLEPDPLLMKRAKQHGVKVLLSLGGSGSGRVLGQACAKPEQRRRLIDSIIKQVEQRGYDGVDVDWEHPSAEWEKVLFFKFSRELRKALDKTGKKRRYTMTCCVSCPEWYARFLDPPELAKIYDYINCMTYDFHGWSKHDGHNSALHRSSCCGCPGAADHLANWVAKGVPAKKLLMGLAFYGREHKRECGFTSWWGWGRCTHKRALWYRDIARLEGYLEEWDGEAKVPYLRKRGSYIYHDNPHSIDLKCKHVNEEGYGGVIIWCLGQDRNELTNGQPLLDAAARELLHR